MIRMFGKGLVATWRPFESGGGSHMRTSQIESDNVTVLDEIVITQTRDGFWATYPLANCSIIWQGKPQVMLINDRCEAIELSVSGKDHTLADTLAEHDYAARGPMKAMQYSEPDEVPIPLVFSPGTTTDSTDNNNNDE